MSNENERLRRELRKIEVVTASKIVREMARAALAATAAPEQPIPENVNVEGLLDDALYNFFNRKEPVLKRRGRPKTAPEERNFCPRCGKRVGVHTCTPPVKESK